MDIPPITVDSEKKPGRPKTASWEDDFEDHFLRRLSRAEVCNTLEAECRYLAEWFAHQQKIQPAGVDKRSISASRIQEKLRDRGYDAKRYGAERQKHVDRLLEAARAFIDTYSEEKQEQVREIETKP